jgi:DNA-binding CsgD family transcriptional regulator
MPAALERRALTLVGEVMGLLDLEELCHALPRVLRNVVPSEFSAINELPADLPHTISVTEPHLPVETHVAFARYGHQNPLVAYYLETRDGRATRFSDLVTRRELHQLQLYREVYAPLDVEYQIAFTLPASPRRVLGIALSRSKRNFTVAERDLLNLARPYLIQAYRNAVAHTELARGGGRQIVISDLRALGLTQRQSEVLRLVAMGHSDESAAAALDIAVRTAHKHLEHCYRALGVRDRSEAAKLAWAATAS